MYNAVLYALHNEKCSGHLGQAKTVGRCRRSRFYWPGMVAFAKRWVRNCPVCAARKHPQYRKRTPLQTYRVGTPMDRVSIDLVGPFHPRTRSGRTTILTITDHYTRWVEAFPLREATTHAIARCVVDFICRFGMPLELHSDQGKNVDGQIMRDVCDLLGIRKTHTTAYHPAGNAVTERENSTIKAMLTAYVNRKQNDWDEHLPAVMMAFRSSVHRTLNETPNAMMLGRQVRLPIDAMVGQPPEIQYRQARSTEYAQDLAESLECTHKSVSETVDAQYQYQKKAYDRHVKAHAYNRWQPVWLREYSRTLGKSQALRNNYSGPWIIVQKLSEVNFRIKRSLKGRSIIVHSDRLKPYYGIVTDSWAATVCTPPTAGEREADE